MWEQGVQEEYPESMPVIFRFGGAALRDLSVLVYPGLLCRLVTVVRKRGLERLLASIFRLCLLQPVLFHACSLPAKRFRKLFQSKSTAVPPYLTFSFVFWVVLRLPPLEVLALSSRVPSSACRSPGAGSRDRTFPIALCTGIHRHTSASSPWTSCNGCQVDESGCE